MVRAGERGAFLALVGGEVGGGQQAAVGLRVIGDLPGHFPVVKIRRVGGDALQGACEVGLNEAFPRDEELAVVLEHPARLRAERQDLAVAEGGEFLLARDVAFARQAHSGGNHLCQPQFAEVLLGVHQPRHGAGHADGEHPNRGTVRHDVARRVEVHVGRGGGGGAFAVVQERRFAAVDVPVRGPDEHEAAAAQVARLRQDDRQREAHGHGGVHGVAACLEDRHACVRGVVVDRHDHRVGTTDRSLRRLRPAGGGQAKGERAAGGGEAVDGRAHVRTNRRTPPGRALAFAP